MNILMVGSGKGSFHVRGKQIGLAVGARVVSAPTDTDLDWADIVVLIKRSAMAWASVVHRVGKLIVWDALDFWRQPEDNGLERDQAIELLRHHLKVIRPAIVVGATEAMADACDGVYLPHHSWSGLTPAPARATVTTVGYQGQRKYLGRWFLALHAECSRRGWTFVVDPPDLRACDILVAFRDGRWDGWMCQEWKSGVKIVNAMAAGRPLISQPSATLREIDPIGSCIESMQELSTAFDTWAPLKSRQSCVQRCMDDASPFTLASVAERYRQILQSVARLKAA